MGREVEGGRGEEGEGGATEGVWVVISHCGQDFHSDGGLKWKVVDAVCATNKYHRDLKSDAGNANESSPVWLPCAVSITSCSSIRS